MRTIEAVMFFKLGNSPSKICILAARSSNFIKNGKERHPRSLIGSEDFSFVEPWSQVQDNALIGLTISHNSYIFFWRIKIDLIIFSNAIGHKKTLK